MDGKGCAHAPLAGAVGLPSGFVSALVASMAAAGFTIATAESLTGGLVSAVLTEVPGSSRVVRGGLVCYATDLKATLVGVDSILLGERGPVDPDVAVQMAAGARARCGARIGLSLTGVAGPEGQGGHLPGEVYIAVVGLGGRWVRRLAAGPASRGRDVIRGAATRSALELLAALVADSSSGGGRRTERGRAIGSASAPGTIADGTSL